MFSFIKQGTYKIVNCSCDATLFRLIPSIATKLDLRFVGKRKGTNRTEFFSQMVFYGGLKQQGKAFSSNAHK